MQNEWKCASCDGTMNAHLNFCFKCGALKNVPAKALSGPSARDRPRKQEVAPLEVPAPSRGPSSVYTHPDMVTLHNQSQVLCEHVPTLLAVIQELSVQATAIESHVTYLDQELHEATAECEQLKKRWVEKQMRVSHIVPIFDDEPVNPLDRELVDRLHRRQSEVKLDIERIAKENNEFRSRLYDMQKKRNIRTTILDSLVLGKPTHSRNVYALAAPGPDALYGVERGAQDSESAQFEMLLITLRYLGAGQDAFLCSEGYFEFTKGMCHDARNQLLDVEEARALGMSDRYEGMPTFSLHSAVANGMGKVGGSLEFM